jgi:hypothetical protein
MTGLAVDVNPAARLGYAAKTFGLIEPGGVATDAAIIVITTRGFEDLPGL